MGDRPALNEIEITPEMIEAGAGTLMRGLLSALREGDPNCFINNEIDENIATIDGRFDLGIVSRRVLEDCISILESSRGLKK